MLTFWTILALVLLFGYLPFVLVCKAVAGYVFFAEWETAGIKNRAAWLLVAAAYIPYINIRMTTQIFAAFFEYFGRHK